MGKPTDSENGGIMPIKLHWKDVAGMGLGWDYQTEYEGTVYIVYGGRGGMAYWTP